MQREQPSSNRLLQGLPLMPVNMSRAPWYKEKLLTRCFPKRASNKERFSNAYDSQRWRFLKSGMDDFRNGCPPFSDNIIIQGRKGPDPVIIDYQKTDALYKPRNLLTKSKITPSKLSPVQAKKDYIAQTEDPQHLLSLYSDLKESMPPELYDDVVKVLDPEMHLRQASSSYSKGEVDFPPPVPCPLKHDVQPEKSYSCTFPWTSKTKNPYTLYSKKKVAKRDQAAKITYEIPPLDDSVKRVTKEFCDWIKSVGGENYNIDEATVMKLFDTTYETSFKSTVPIKIVGLYQIPAELRQCLRKEPQWKTVRRSTKVTPSEPKWEKIKYGAWYLPPKTWKKKRASEQDDTPECLQVFLNLRKKMFKKEQNQQEERPLHGTYAFEQFLEAKGYRKPAFLLQMLAANKPEVLEESEGLSRRFSIKTYKDLKLQSFSFI